MDLLEEVMERVVAAGRRGISIAQIAKDLGLRPYQVFSLLRPQPNDVRLQVQTNDDGEIRVLDQDYRGSAQHVLVLRDPESFPRIVAEYKRALREQLEEDDDTHQFAPEPGFKSKNPDELDQTYGNDLVLDRRAEVGTLPVNLDEACALFEMLDDYHLSGFLPAVQFDALREKLLNVIPEYMWPWLNNGKRDLDEDGHRIDRIYKTVRTALIESRAVQIVYMSENSKMTTRTIRPFEFFAAKTGMLIYAYCYLRHEHRHFRIDRIISATVVDD